MSAAEVVVSAFAAISCSVKKNNQDRAVILSTESDCGGMQGTMIGSNHATAAVPNAVASEFRPSVQVASANHCDVYQKFLKLQWQHNTQLLETHNDITCAMTLPLLKCQSFAFAFQAMIASSSSSDADRLYYVQQHLKSEKRALVDGCLHMNPDQGYTEAWNLHNSE